MAGTYDTEEQRIIDRIGCIAFRKAQDAGEAFIVQFGLSLIGGKDWNEEDFRHLYCKEITLGHQR